MTREEFENWLNKQRGYGNRYAAILFKVAECIFGEEFDDHVPLYTIRQHVYDFFPEWH